MSGEDDTSTRPISVAELLAKNGTIGSPPVGGRRRRRRGNADAVTVAELTGEIPIIRTGEMPVVTEADLASSDLASADTPGVPEPEPETEAEAAEAQAPEVEPESEAEVLAAEVADVQVVESEAADPEPEAPATEAVESAETPLVELPPERAHAPSPRRGRGVRPERSRDPRPVRRSARPAAKDPAPAPEPAETGAVEDAELMSPDLIDDADFAAEFESDADDALFGGDSVVDELARRRAEPAGLLDTDGAGDVAGDADDAATDDGRDDDGRDDDGRDDDTADGEPLSRGQQILRGSVIVFQSVIAVAFGAGLFLAFDQLWQWNNIIALVLSVLVILGLVVGVRVVRKTEDIASTLIAVVVGAMVTLGPLALQHTS